MAPTRGGVHSVADQLSCIAAYFSAAPQRRLQHKQSHGRLPLAWVATSPSARLVAEQHNAWVVLPFDSSALAGCPYATDDYEENSFGAALANATTPLFLLKDALGLGEAPAAAVASASAMSERPSAEVKDTGAAAAALPTKNIFSWLSQATESLADVDHAASPVEPEKTPLMGTSRAKPPPQKATRPGTGLSGPKVEDPLEAARSCGVHVAGVTAVLVSGVHLYQDHLSRISNSAAAPSTNKADERRVNPSGTLLFSSTTCCGGSVSSLLSVPPNAAVYDAIPSRADPQQHNAAEANGTATRKRRPSIFRDGAELHDDDGGAVDETAHDPQTAASVFTVQQVNELHQQAREGKTADEVYTTVWYRHVFVDNEEATGDVLCGVSQWWLQRPVRVQEMPTTNFTAAAAASHRTTPLAAPPLYVKFVANIGADLWWPHRLLSVVHQRAAEHPWHATTLLRWLAFLWVLCAVVLESLLHGVPEVPAHHAGATHGAALVTSFNALGAVYGGSDQLAALDVSHTAVRGVHVLSCAVGKVTSMQTRQETDGAALQPRRAADRFVALDVAGCIQLHHRKGELNAAQALLDSLHTHCADLAPTAWKDTSSSPLPLVDLLTTLSLRHLKTCAARSAAGLGTALLSHHGSLTWVSGAGCSLDNAALHELGNYALLAEAVAAIRAPSSPPAATDSPTSSCSICAMDLTSALSLDDLNPAGYLVHLEQLLVPFTYVTDDGIALLDGHTFPRRLSEYLALCKAEYTSSLSLSTQALVKDVIASLESLTVAAAPWPSENGTHRPASAAAAAAAANASHHDIIEALHQRFRSHLYQIDFTYCSFLSSINPLVRQQRLELLNMSQTRLNRAGLFSGADRRHAGQNSSAEVHTPPLRLFIAEMCEHLSDLRGLAHLTTLECVVVRSGSLGDDGLRALCTADMKNLQLVDLSYCDRLHHVGCLADLPALDTLILDSTDVLPAEVRLLRGSRSLETLSLRFCSEFAFVGKDKNDFEAALGKFPSLKHYVYEDLVGDDELRKKTD